jgi:SAM-dependent methyltransferase
MPRSLAEIAQGFDTDKAIPYIDHFERHFSHLRDKPIKMLELGVFHGGSLLMWHEYFWSGLIVGLDIKRNPIKAMPERMRFYQGSQDDEVLLDRIGAECAPDGFDIVIDDASHIGQLARASFRNLFQRHVKPGGIYVVEDWGTGYWHAWPDGKGYQPIQEKDPGTHANVLLKRVFRKLGWVDHRAIDSNFPVHNFGMVGFIKQLVDEIAWADVTAPNRGNSDLPPRVSAIHEMTIYNGHAFIVKAC